MQETISSTDMIHTKEGNDEDKEKLDLSTIYRARIFIFRGGSSEEEFWLKIN